MHKTQKLNTWQKSRLITKNMYTQLNKTTIFNLPNHNHYCNYNYSYFLPTYTYDHTRRLRHVLTQAMHAVPPVVHPGEPAPHAPMLSHSA